MAKRTNKTDHVLNLLSSGNKKTEPPSEQEEPIAHPPVEPGKKPETETHEKITPAASNVSVVHMSENDENPIGESVKDSLEEDWDAFLRQKEEANGEPGASPDPEGAPGGEESEEAAPDLGDATDEAEPQRSQEERQEETSSQPEAAEPPEQGEPDGEEVDYTIVNVMEYLVRDKAINYMRQFDNCTCSRCIEDTVALSLTNLPSKYVVVNKSAVSPLLNFYEKKYAGQIIVEITKACMTVDEFPHH